MTRFAGLRSRQDAGPDLCRSCGCIYTPERGVPNATADWCDDIECVCHSFAYAEAYAEALWRRTDRAGDIEADELELQYRWGYL